MKYLWFFSLQYPAEGRKLKPSAAWPVSTWQRKITLTCSGQPCQNSLVRSKEKHQFFLGMAQGVGMGSGSSSGTGKTEAWCFPQHSELLAVPVDPPCPGIITPEKISRCSGMAPLVVGSSSGRGKPTKSKGQKHWNFYPQMTFQKYFQRMMGTMNPWRTCSLNLCVQPQSRSCDFWADPVNFSGHSGTGQAK